MITNAGTPYAQHVRPVIGIPGTNGNPLVGLADKLMLNSG